MSHQKCSFGYVSREKSQINLHISTVLSEPPLGAFWIGKDAKVLGTFRQPRLWSDCTDAQVDLSLPKAHMADGTFSYVAIQIFHGVRSRGFNIY